MASTTLNSKLEASLHGNVHDKVGKSLPTPSKCSGYEILRGKDPKAPACMLLLAVRVLIYLSCALVTESGYVQDGMAQLRKLQRWSNSWP